MKTSRLSITKDCHDNITLRNTRQKTSETVTEHCLPIPFDLIFEIFSRLPLKSIAICRCVSKLWASNLRCPGFTDLFLTKSSARPPQILFACSQEDKVIIFSSQPTQNPNENSSPLAADHLMHLPLYNFSGMVSHVGGLLCFVDKGRAETTPVICNPSTRQSLTLPKVKTRRRWNQVRSDLGYDPVDKQFKVLAMTWSCGPREWEEHQVLTLGTEKPSWRIIECCIPHDSSENSYPQTFSSDRICINGVLYYRAFHTTLEIKIIVCFDYRYEKFSFFEVVGIEFSNTARLVNYNGKLGFLLCDYDVHGYVAGISTRIELIVIGDWKNQEWSKHTYILPASWKTIVGDAKLSFVGVTRTNEIVLSQSYPVNNFYLFYYNMERNTLRRVEVKGTNLRCKIHTLLDHVEDVRLI